jgi:hypothetical protein
MSDRDSSPSIGDWGNTASGGAGDEGGEAGEEAGLAGLGTPPANIGDSNLQDFETNTAPVTQAEPGGADRGSLGGLGAGLGATRGGSGAGSDGGSG